MKLMRCWVAILLLAGLTGCETTSGDTPSPQTSAASSGAGTNEAEQLVHCDRSLGTATIVEPDVNAVAALQTIGLQSPTPVLRIMVSQSNCYRIIDSAATGGRVMAQFAITPNILLSNPDAGGFNPAGLIGGVVGLIPGGSLLSSAAGSVHTKEVQTALFLSNTHTGEQIAAVQGVARATDFSISLAGLGGAANSVGAYSNTPEGKVVMAAYLNAFNKLVAQMRQGRSAQASPTR
jgi:hypothetical protein